MSYKCSQEFVNISISHQLPDAYCNHEEKPAASIPCYGPCHQYRWRYHDWEPVISKFIDRVANVQLAGPLFYHLFKFI